MIFVLKIMVLLILCKIGKTDWDTRKISNKWSALLALNCFLYGHLTFQMPIVEQILGMLSVSGLLLFIVFLKPGAVGGGDIKLAAASGMMLGAINNFKAFYLGLLIAAVYIGIRFLCGKMSRTEEIPLGPFLCAGIAAYVLVIRP